MRSRTLAIGGLALGGLLAVIVSAQPWWRAEADGADVAFTGSDASAGLTQALALVVLAGTLLALTLRARGRRILGVLLTVAGVGVVIVGAIRLRPSGANVRTRLREVSLADQYELVGTAWPWIYAVAGVLVLGGAVVMVATSGRWPQRADRFQRATREAAVSNPDEADPAALWKAMDAGIDPTAPPDATSGDEDDTMGASTETIGDSAGRGSSQDPEPDMDRESRQDRLHGE